MLDKTMEAIRKFTLNISVAAILIMAVRKYSKSSQGASLTSLFWWSMSSQDI